MQGVGPGQPRLIVIPFALLVADESSLDPEVIAGQRVEAGVVEEGGHWIVTEIAFASKVLRR